MIKILFICSFPTIMSLIFILLFPAKPIEQNLLFLFLSNSLFFIICYFFCILTYYIASGLSSKSTCVKSDNRKKIPNGNFLFIGLAPIIGLIFLVYDRIFLRGINYTNGLRNARYEWLQSEGGSFFGVAGNLLIPISYVGIFLVIRYAHCFKRIEKIIIVLSGFLSIFGHAFLNGGRSNILLLALVVVVAFLCSTYSFGNISTKSYIVLFLCAFLGFYYVSKIIQSSVDMDELEFSEFILLGIRDMQAVPVESFFREEHSSLVYVFLYSLMYLFHGQWTTQILYEIENKEGFHSIVSAPTVMLDKLGFIDLGLDERAFSESGAFVSLPGSIYYDFGWIGLLSYSVFLGIFMGLSVFFILKEYKISLFKIVIILTSFSIVLFSPILPVYGFSYFSFILFSFFIVWLFNLCILRKKINF